MFSLIATFTLKKLKTELKILSHSSHTIALSKKRWIYVENADISRINRIFLIKKYIFLNYIYVGTYLPNLKFLA